MFTILPNVYSPKNAFKPYRHQYCLLRVPQNFTVFTIYFCHIDELNLFDGEVTKLAGIYLIVFLSFVMVICSVFPYLKKEERFDED